MTEQYAAGPWVPVSERLPERGRVVLIRRIRDTGPVWGVAYQFCGIWYSTSGTDTDGVTHWAEVNL